MTENLRVSTIIVTRDRHTLLHRAVNSVFEQTYRPIEIIVVDNQSLTPTEKMSPPDGISINVVKTPVIMNSGAARNFGFDHSTGDLISFLDDDDYYFPNKTKQQVAAFEKEPNVDVTFLNTERVDHNGNRLSLMAGTVGLPVMRHVHLNGLMVTREIMIQERFEERLSQHVDDHLIYRLFDRFKWRHVNEIGAVWNYDNRPDQITRHTLLGKLQNLDRRYANTKIMCEDYAHKFDLERSLRKDYYGRHAILALLTLKPIEAIRYALASVGAAKGPRKIPPATTEHPK